MNLLCPYCKCEMQVQHCYDLITGLPVSLWLECLNSDCPREEMSVEELQSAWDAFIEEDRHNGN